MELVESLSEENGQKFNRGKLELVPLGSFSVPMEAQMFQELLDIEGTSARKPFDVLCSVNGVIFKDLPAISHRSAR